jgi:hypothetical protein
VADKFLVLTQAAASCTVAIPPSGTNHGANISSGAFDVTVAGGCGWTAATTNTWITITAGASGSGNGPVSYSVAANPNTTARTGRVTVTGPSNAASFTISQDGVFIACPYRLSPTSRTHGSSAASNSVSLTVSNTCDWDLLNTNTWITILSPTNGTGPATISYLVASNLTVNERTGLVLIADQVFTLVQHGISCDYSLSPSNRTHGFSAATNSITLNVASVCDWTLANSNGWIQFSSPASGSGSATMNYTVDGNTMPLARTGLVFIADQVFTLVQSAAPCLFELTPASRAHGYVLETGLIAVATSPLCDWTTTTTNSWITITAGASRSGSGSAGYRVDANPTGMPRTGRIIVGDQTYLVTQSGAPCTFAIAPTNRPHGSGTETGTVMVTTLEGCDWSVDNANRWINILSGTNASGSATVTYRVEANPSLNPRSGTLLIAGETFLVTQAGFTCVFRLSPTNRNHGYGASTGLVSVTTSNGCLWTVVNTNDWVTITTPTSGDGNGSFGYAITENIIPSERSGVIVISGQAFNLRQLAASCTVQLSPASRAHGQGATTGSVIVDTLQGCGWTASTTNDWITILSGTNGSGSNLLTYAITANPAAFERTGAVMIDLHHSAGGRALRARPFCHQPHPRLFGHHRQRHPDPFHRLSVDRREHQRLDHCHFHGERHRRRHHQLFGRGQLHNLRSHRRRRHRGPLADLAPASRPLRVRADADQRDSHDRRRHRPRPRYHQRQLPLDRGQHQPLDHPHRRHLRPRQWQLRLRRRGEHRPAPPQRGDSGGRQIVPRHPGRRRLHVLRRAGQPRPRRGRGD